MEVMLLLFVLMLYFIPAIVASTRDHPQSAPIFLLNLLLGWTLVFWVIALVWAAMAFQPQDSLRKNS